MSDCTEEVCPGTPHRGHTTDTPVAVQCSEGMPVTRKPIATVQPDPALGISGKWQPQGREGERPEDLDLSEWVGQAIGAASVCWVGGTGALEFDSAAAARVAEGLEAHVRGLFTAFIQESERRRAISERYMQTQLKAAKDSLEEPRLGLASTREMLKELHSRATITTPSAWLANATHQGLEVCPAEVLDYRTVGGK